MRFITGALLSFLMLPPTFAPAAGARWWRDFPDDRGPFWARREKGAFIGVAVTRVPEAMREHLKLPAGVGLLVEKVEPDSPAESAGLKPHDVLHKLNEQMLINEHQFRVLVRTFKPGDEVTLNVVRRGETRNITLKLAERELPPISEYWPLRLPDIRIERDLEELWRDLPRPPRITVRPHDGGSMSVTVRDGAAQAHLYDGEHVLFLNVDRDGRKHLSAYSTTGRHLFSGYIDTEDQRKSVPQEIAEKVKRLERSIEQQSDEKAAKDRPRPAPRDKI